MSNNRQSDDDEQLDQAIRALAECILHDPTEQLGSMPLNTLIKTIITISGSVVRNVPDNGNYTVKKALPGPQTGDPVSNVIKTGFN